MRSKALARDAGEAMPAVPAWPVTSPSVEEDAGRKPVIAGERADEPARELPAKCGLESLARLRLCGGNPGHAGTVVEEAVGGPSLVERQNIHGPLCIVAAEPAADPWREGTRPVPA
jgi:hypothetical protein